MHPQIRALIALTETPQGSLHTPITPDLGDPMASSDP